MKRIFEQNFYELLEIPPESSREEIRHAYQQMKGAFHEDSLAIYSLYDPSDLSRIQERLEEAYRTLINDRSRAAYDASLMGVSVNGEKESHYRVEAERPEVEVFTSEDVKNPLDPELHEFLNHLEDVCNGRLLKKYREYQGISLEWVAKETRINMTYLQFIEDDNYAGLPHLVYLKSYLFQYTEFLGIDPYQAVEGYLKNYSQNPSS